MLKNITRTRSLVILTSLGTCIAIKLSLTTLIVGKKKFHCKPTALCCCDGETSLALHAIAVAFLKWLADIYVLLISPSLGVLQTTISEFGWKQGIKARICHLPTEITAGTYRSSLTVIGVTELL